jgi:hypothetical protein
MVYECGLVETNYDKINKVCTGSCSRYVIFKITKKSNYIIRKTKPMKVFV